MNQINHATINIKHADTQYKVMLALIRCNESEAALSLAHTAYRDDPTEETWREFTISAVDHAKRLTTRDVAQAELARLNCLTTTKAGTA